MKMKCFWNNLNIAFSMFSKLPAAQCDWTEDNMKYLMCFFPCIGIVIGVLCFGWHILASWLDIAGSLRNCILMLIPVAVSGGIHLDGLLDTADAMSSWRTKERRLEILKDSHTGAFAIIACAVYFFLLYGVVDMVQGNMVSVYIMTFFLTRSFSGFSVVTFPKASEKGTVAKFSQNAQTRMIQIITMVYALFCIALMIWLHPLYGIAAAIGAVSTFLWYYQLAVKYFGGINGDLAGCFLSVCELIIPLYMVFADLIYKAL